MSTRRSLLRPEILRIVAASSSGVGLFASLDKEQDAKFDKDSNSWINFPQVYHFQRSILQQCSPLSHFEPNRTSMEGFISNEGSTTSHHTRDETPPKKNTLQYDFVIIGHGNVGESAVNALREMCPKATIAVVDPLRPRSSKRDENYVSSHVDFVTGFNPSNRTVQMLSHPTTQLQYRYGILVATGSRGAPPPLELFEESSLQRLLELRTTELVGNKKRPALPPHEVRRRVVRAASKGEKVAILGSGWEAVDLACAAAELATKGQTGKGSPSTTMVFGNPGPAWHILPQYLSSELRKKMRKQGIEIQDRTIVRYIASIDRVATKTQPARRVLELHTAKTYDLLETQRKTLDLLVVAPDTTGTKGTAALPTTEIPSRMTESGDGRPWYKTWSQLTKTSSKVPSSVVCFEDDGRISVNTELCAASKVYAAGSVAKYPNSSTGNATVAGEGTLDGVQAGKTAAFNMSRDYVERMSWNNHADSYCTDSFAAHSVPTWRSDITSYTSSGRNAVPSSLSFMGIQALCVGECDSERHSTRGFWWTNTSAQRRLARLIEEEETDPDGLIRRKTRRRITRRRRQLGLVPSPVYGIGVVYYLDKVGRIRGIMTWGLPFTSVDSPHELNQLLRNRMKDVIVTNGGVSALDAEENYHIMNSFLAKESQRLVKLAVKGATSDTGTYHRLDGPIQGFSKPLYRYTEARPARRATVNVLKRTDQGGLGVLGEDLYARDELALEEESDTFRDNSHDDVDEYEQSNLATPMYPINVAPYNLAETSKGSTASASSLEELNQYLAIQRGWEDNDNRARPGKEDPLWLRPGDERKNTSQRQLIIEYYRNLMFPHRS